MHRPCFRYYYQCKALKKHQPTTISLIELGDWIVWVEFCKAFKVICSSPKTLRLCVSRAWRHERRAGLRPVKVWTLSICQVINGDQAFVDAMRTRLLCPKATWLTSRRCWKCLEKAFEYRARKSTALCMVWTCKCGCCGSETHPLSSGMSWSASAVELSASTLLSLPWADRPYGLSGVRDSPLKDTHTHPDELKAPLTVPTTQADMKERLPLLTGGVEPKLHTTLLPLLDPLLEQVYVQLFFLQHLL